MQPLLKQPKTRINVLKYYNYLWSKWTKIHVKKIIIAFETNKTWIQSLKRLQPPLKQMKLESMFEKIRVCNHR
jgi:hypothetical protein